MSATRAWNSTLPQRTTGLPRGKGFSPRATGLPTRTLLRARSSLGAGDRAVALRATRQQRRQAPYSFPQIACELTDARDISLLDLARCCQRCGSTRNLHRHHRRGKAGGGSQRRPHTHCLCNAVTLCLPCHEWAHRKGRVQAEAEGFVVSQSVKVPAVVSVMRFAEAGGGASQFPSCDGRWLDEEPDLEVAA